VGAIVALSPELPEAVKTVLRSWGPGRYDAYFNQDGVSDPVLIPPAYGLRGVALETYTGEGPVSYWNSYVAVTQMHAQGYTAELEAAGASPIHAFVIAFDGKEVRVRTP